MEHRQELGHKEPHICYDKQNADNSSYKNNNDNNSTTTESPVAAVEDQDVSFFHDFIAGGIAGSASVVVGHPMDTLKVRMQTSTCGSSMWSLATSYGGMSSLFRGMAAPLSTACVINAIIFSSYGWSSRMFDEHIGGEDNTLLSGADFSSTPIHDSTIKAFSCGSFAGLVQALVVCPQEHVKCRLQIQHGKGSPDHLYKGPLQAAKTIVQQYGVSGLYRGWWITCWREVPAFGAYFAFYDIFKDKINSFFVNQEAAARSAAEQSKQQALRENDTNSSITSDTLNVVSTSSLTSQDVTFSLPPAIAYHRHTWISSALAGGLTGALTWAMVYPFDVIKTQIQTMPLTEETSKRRIHAVTQHLIQQYGWRHLFRGLGITCLRAFPVNGIIFPVYEYTLMHVCSLEY